MVIMAGGGAGGCGRTPRIARSRCCPSAASRCSSTSSAAQRRRIPPFIHCHPLSRPHDRSVLRRRQRRWQVHIDYLREESPLGTAGAVGAARAAATGAICGFERRCLDGCPLRRAARISLPPRRGGHHGGAPPQWQHPSAWCTPRASTSSGFEEKPVAAAISTPASTCWIRRRSKKFMKDRNFVRTCPRCRTRAAGAGGANDYRVPDAEPWLDVGQAGADRERARSES